jgi:RNA polymerase sporulation-specific sigma factor
MTNYESLTDEELLGLLREGDARAEEALYARYKQIVRSKARMYFLIGADREDIIQEGMIGLYKAVMDYQFDRHASFRSFAELCITRQIITAIKSATRKKHMPLNTYISFNRSVYEGDNERPLIDVLTSTRISDPEEVLISRENYAAVADSIEHSLSKLEHNALGLYLYGYSYQQIADALQISTKSVDNAIQRVKKKLEARLKELE